jgi:hypothetical protein
MLAGLLIRQRMNQLDSRFFGIVVYKESRPEDPRHWSGRLRISFPALK